VRRITRWLEALPHPLLACEIAPGYVAAARWTQRGGSLDSFAVEPLPPGAIVPSAVESNLANVAAVRAAMGRVFARLRAKGHDVALLIPDPVIRVFVLHFDEFPRAASEAVPMLRWKLKKSVPFESEETLVSYMRQAPRDEGVDVVTGLARLRIVREYEMLAESAGMMAGVVMSSTLATLPLLDDRRPVLLARISGSNLTTAIIREGILCGYRCTDLPTDAFRLTPSALLDEIYPVAAYYQDTWSEGIQSVSLAGLAERTGQFRRPLEAELRCPVSALLSSAAIEGRISDDAQPLADRELDALVGWMLNRGA
jgi:type IV pilus assembly protein PilM